MDGGVGVLGVGGGTTEYGVLQPCERSQRLPSGSSPSCSQGPSSRGGPSGLIRSQSSWRVEASDSTASAGVPPHCGVFGDADPASDRLDRSVALPIVQSESVIPELWADEVVRVGCKCAFVSGGFAAGGSPEGSDQLAAAHDREITDRSSRPRRVFLRYGGKWGRRWLIAGGLGCELGCVWGSSSCNHHSMPVGRFDDSGERPWPGSRLSCMGGTFRVVVVPISARASAAEYPVPLGERGMV